VGRESKFNTGLLRGALEIGILSGLYGEFDFFCYLGEVVGWELENRVENMWS
jgi:hypothetical protein